MSSAFMSIRLRTPLFCPSTAEVPEATAAAILGHEMRGITFGRYGHGVSLAVKRKTIENLAYPATG